MPESVHTIYPPPRSGLPYLVVTFSGEKVLAVPARTSTEARSLAARESIAQQSERAARRNSTGRVDA